MLASVGKDKFLGTKQFTVRGTKSWTGTVRPFNRTDPLDTKIVNGEHTATWQWEATFRMKGAEEEASRVDAGEAAQPTASASRGTRPSTA